jgi:hypothetical protein
MAAGFELFNRVPVPSWPALLLPQHCTVPFVSAAHVKSSPAESAETPLWRLGTGMAAAIVSPVVPCPS